MGVAAFQLSKESIVMKTIILSIFMVSFLVLVRSECRWKSSSGKRVAVAEGEVTRVRPTTVEVCSNGAIRIKKKEDVPTPLKFACGGCKWKGRIICSGDVVRDLKVWWFESQCGNGRMRPIGRSWLDVSQDPRYKNSKP